MLYEGIFLSLFIAFALLFQQLSVGKQNISWMFELSVFNYINSWIFLNHPPPPKKWNPDWCCIELTEMVSGLYWSPFWLLQSKKLSQIGIQLPWTDIKKGRTFHLYFAASFLLCLICYCFPSSVRIQHIHNKVFFSRIFLP